jgi:hypothetical protein
MRWEPQTSPVTKASFAAPVTGAMIAPLGHQELLPKTTMRRDSSESVLDANQGCESHLSTRVKKSGSVAKLWWRRENGLNASGAGHVGVQVAPA